MGFDVTHKVVYGDDATTPRAFGRDVVLDYLQEKLNDPDGPYYERLGLAPDRLVVATSLESIAEANYGDAQKHPVAFGTLGKARTMESGKKIGDTNYRGERHYVESMFDFALDAPAPDDENAENDNPITTLAAEETFVEIARSVIRKGRADLTARGVNSISIEADEEAQRTGMGRNPHRVEFLVVTLDDYTPAP